MLPQSSKSFIGLARNFFFKIKHENQHIIIRDIFQKKIKINNLQ
jgi:hypothetical protein